jgi:hypothetical protein
MGKRYMRRAHARSCESGTFGAASDCRVVMKGGVAVDMTIAGDSNVVKRRRRQRCRERALGIIAAHGCNGASALNIGIGMTDGTVQGRYMGKAAKERLGLMAGSALVQDRLAVVTRDNRFMLPPLARTYLKIADCCRSDNNVE